jgi:CRISPR-associated endonuclease/helicase Cas3
VKDAALAPEQYAAFVGELFDRRPFPWQQRLVREVLSTGRWPAAIDVPTALGKTSLIDIAVFVAAAAAGAASESRPGRRRVFFVIDRRIVVDEAFEHARGLADGLAGAAEGTTARAVADALQRAAGLGASDPPLVVNRMRGGVTWDWRWLDRPDQPAIVVGTVDQVGSRFLFRGYGVGEYLRPIDASLVGTDSLIVIDEAHLAEPFARTVSDARDFDRTELEFGQPIIVTMTATPGDRGTRAFGIDDDDLADGIAARRLRAPKTAHLLACTKDRETPIVLAELARHLVETTDAEVVGIVCNTVARAREAYEALRAHVDDERVLLLTGRIRPVDRDLLLQRWLARLSVDRDRKIQDGPWFVVATQTIEVGANLDFDCLVTESAALDALVQRFGRLNRLGLLDRSPAVVLHSSQRDDPVYGVARDATWEWLCTLGEPAECKSAAAAKRLELEDGIDFSPLGLRDLTSRVGDVAALLAPKPVTPVLVPAALDAWARTSPTPAPDTPVAPFLHGIERDLPTVEMVWRADLDPQDADKAANWPVTVDLVPPSAEESVEVPLAAVRRWLSGQAQPAAQVADVPPVAPDTLDDAASGPLEMPPVLRYLGRERAEVVSPRDLQPGDLVVCPAAYGGLDDYGWAPDSLTPVLDVVELAHRRGRPVLRASDATLLPLVARDLPDAVAEASRLLEDVRRALGDPEADASTAMGVFLEGLASLLDPGAGPVSARLAENLDQLLGSAPRVTIPEPAPARPIALARARSVVDADDASPLSSSLTGQPVTLAQHSEAVRARAATFARNLWLPDELVDIVAAAAGWHDLGKHDPRFLVMLHGGDRLAAEVAADPLAKSGIDPANRAAFVQAQRRAGYPGGMRHEAASAEALRCWIERTSGVAGDAELLVHLVAAHHGRARPLITPVRDSEPVEYDLAIDGASVRLRSDHGADWTAPRRFAALNRRYGRWGLALLECIVRLADIACSEEGT